jgi:hypothetical protein
MGNVTQNHSSRICTLQTHPVPLMITLQASQVSSASRNLATGSHFGPLTPTSSLVVILIRTCTRNSPSEEIRAIKPRVSKQFIIRVSCLLNRGARLRPGRCFPVRQTWRVRLETLQPSPRLPYGKIRTLLKTGVRLERGLQRTRVKSRVRQKEHTVPFPTCH